MPERLSSRAVRRALIGGGLLAGSGLALTAAQVAWVVNRPLPSLQGLDASGPLGDGRPGEPVRVVVLGDSTVTGPGLEDADEIWVRRALAALEASAPLEVVSLAVGGSRVADVSRLVGTAIELKPHLVVLAVGCNDAIHGTPPARFARDLDAIVVALLEHVPVIAASNIGDLGNLARVPRPLNLALRWRSRLVSRRIEQVVRRHDRAVLLDVTTTDARFQDHAMFAGDLFHPNAEGHAVWAEAALPGLARALGMLGRLAEHADQAALARSAAAAASGAAWHRPAPGPAPGDREAPGASDRRQPADRG